MQLLEDNPLADWVELPAALAGLRYSALLCGVVRGALEMVNLDVECAWVRDVLAGDDANEMRLKLLSSAAEAYPYKDDD